MPRSHCWATRGDCIATTPTRTKTMNGAGWRIEIDQAAPMASATRKSATDTTFTRGSEGVPLIGLMIEAICCSFLYSWSRVRFELGENLVEGESGRGGVGQESGHESPPPPFVL